MNTGTGYKKVTKPLSARHLLGYLLGDFGGCMTFAVMGAYLLPYYTDVAGLKPGHVATLFLLIKIWDAINDPLMGGIMDKLYAKHQGVGDKFRPWLLRATPLLAITAVLMLSIPAGLPVMGKLVWAYVTYLLYEASYTIFNIPYGSLLSAMGNTEEEHSKLSSARGLGSILGNLIPMMVFPILLDKMRATPQLSYSISIVACAIVGLICCFLSYKWTEERIKPKAVAAESEVKFTDIIEVFKKNRPFLAVSISGAAAMMYQSVVNGIGVYYFRENLNALSMMALANFIGMGLAFISLLIIPGFVKRFGTIRTILGSVTLGLVFLIIPYFFADNLWLTIISKNALGTSFIGIAILLQWGLVGEVIDYNEFILNKRTEGSIYGTFNFCRRIGQAVGMAISAAVLGWIGYQIVTPGAEAVRQTAEVLHGIRNWYFGAPIVGAVIQWLALKFIWNITDETRAEMVEAGISASSETGTAALLSDREE